MTNVVKLNNAKSKPTDLLPLSEFQKKYGIKYDYLYKKSIIEGLIEPYFTPEWALSENEVFIFLQKEKQKKLNKIRGCNEC